MEQQITDAIRQALEEAGVPPSLTKQLRYADLVRLGIVANRTTLSNWIHKRGFPQGRLIGPNSRAWTESEIREFLARSPSALKPTPRRRPQPIPASGGGMNGFHKTEPGQR